MIFEETAISDVWLVRPQAHNDERGSFARFWCAREFEARGIEFFVAQANVSLNRKRGTLRGLHYQEPPKPEAKLVRCSRGALFDVAVDLRAGSSTLGRVVTAELTAENGKMLYIPKGCAHGFQTLLDDTEVTYLMGEFYDPDLAGGVKWDDSQLAINWPIHPPIVSERDVGAPPFDPDHPPFT